jgi:predicted XRE-type DNA-binding protein
MKQKKANRKLIISKHSVSKLSNDKMQKIKGGAIQKTTGGFTSVIGCETENCCPTLTN